jgi:hypothetical protein
MAVGAANIGRFFHTFTLARRFAADILFVWWKVPMRLRLAALCTAHKDARRLAICPGAVATGVDRIPIHAANPRILRSRHRTHSRRKG